VPKPKSVRQIILPCSTPMPNFLFDVVMPRVQPAHFYVLLAIVRKTWGWDKKRDWISLSQFKRLTGLARGTIVRALKLWQAAGLVRRARAGIRGTIAYEIPLDADLKEITGRLDGLVHRTNRSKRRQLTGLTVGPSPVQPVDTQKATQEKQIGESNASPLPDEEGKPPLTRTQLAIRRRDLRGYISSLKEHLKKPLLQPSERVRITAAVAEYRAELAQVEAALAAMPPRVTRPLNPNCF